MTTINVAVVKPDLTPWPFAVVSVRLIDAGSGGAVEESVMSSTSQIRCSDVGLGSIELTPNADIDPAGTFYAFAVENSSPATVRCIEVPDSPTALSWADSAIQVLVDDPPVFIPAPNLASVGMVPTVNGTGDAFELAAPGSGTAASVGALIHGATSKTTPVDADEIALSDSAASWVLKRLTWANLKAAAKTYFDTLYAAIVHVHAGSDITSGTVATARLGSGTANSGTYLRGDQTWAAVSTATGDVVGPASATADSLARFDGTSGKLLKNGAVIGTDVESMAWAPRHVHKSSDETISSDNTLSNDATLLYPIGASEVWDIDVELIYTSGTTPDFQVAVTGPSGATCNLSVFGPATTDNVVAHPYRTLSSYQALGTATPSGGLGTTHAMVHIRGVIINSTNAGNVTIQWAQNTSDASNTVVRKGSTLTMRRLA